MPQDHEWPESHAEQTDVFPAVPARTGQPEQQQQREEPHEEQTSAEQLDGADQPTEQVAAEQVSADQQTQRMQPAQQAQPGQAGQQASSATEFIARPPTREQPTQFIAKQGDGELPTVTTGAAAPTEFTAGVDTTASIPPVPPGPPEPPAQQDGSSWRRFRKPAFIAGGVFAALVLVYGIDLLVTTGDVPRGVTVAGVDVGGMSHSKAESLLREQIEPRVSQPVAYTAGDVEDSFTPQEAGLKLDWSATLEQAGDQPLNPITRLTSFFSTREVGVVTQAEPNQLENAMSALRKKIDHEPVEGNIAFEGATAVPVDPKNGQRLKVDKAQSVILAHWASGDPLKLPVDSTPVTITPEAVRVALTQVAEPAVSGPVVVRGEGADGTLEPEEIAQSLTFEPKDGSLVPKVDHKKVVGAVGPDLADTETEGKDAKILIKDGQPTVEPSEDGNKIKWDVTLKPLLDVLKQTEQRELTAHYEKQPAKLTTDEANELGVKEVIGEFTTGGFADDSGVNIRTVAEKVNGAVVKPGDTFSLNGYTGPRTEAQGYVPAGIIENGAPGKAVGGGISQFATTLYNAYYFAGLADAGHQEHSYYISRYPEGREATVFQNPDGSSVIDVGFTNDSQTGVVVETVWTPSEITVRLWGTKRYEVESVTGDRTDIVEPETTKGPKEDCKASNGGPGFTVTDTRILKDASSGAVVREEPRTVTYKPQAKVVCKGGDGR
ncbi:Vancomycin resistance protein YoaR, contains peptidoglycan-binding and VanW domains [Prauserella marina]|uniref:Vancomycin resistance protein YoaR, contains peptidoglycan-binding and VanW domains n=1 Tax=Prauserella marina TaxID=530584 RepID=A0A1G6TY70_9PSEU|nr:VanW family protein [Prauserella marina]PWV75462.1 vancomycin resistance protein YoaR [Prauserella marina]SDD34019.1 Vancomycin resistance protein YoaR, contains peptidoglycan-binding and VanW domains [Prauserella marina]